MSGAELTTLYVGTDHCAAIFQNFLLMVVHEDPLPDLPTHQVRWVEHLRRQASGPLGFIVVLRPENPPPKEAARTTIKRAFELFGESMSFGAMVVEKTGFTAAAQRSALTMIMLAARPRFPLKVFAKVSEACNWMSEQASSGSRPISGTELLATVEHLKSSYDAGQASPMGAV
jgi:hypothetical protein